jgi:hypothetical protein
MNTYLIATTSSSESSMRLRTFFCGAGTYYLGAGAFFIMRSSSSSSLNILLMFYFGIGGGLIDYLVCGGWRVALTGVIDCSSSSSNSFLCGGLTMVVFSDDLQFILLQNYFIGYCTTLGFFPRGSSKIFGSPLFI